MIPISKNKAMPSPENGCVPKVITSQSTMPNVSAVV
jgi:hypothetical protein